GQIGQWTDLSAERAEPKRGAIQNTLTVPTPTSTDHMIRLDNISKQNGHHLLFVDASMGIMKGEKEGLVGPTGAAKSTLFRMIAGQDRPDDGQVSIETGMTIGYFSQDVGEMSGQSAVAAVMDGVGPASALAAEMAQLEAAMVDPDQAANMDALVERYGEV